MSKAKPNIDKLPKWAQGHIQNLERRLEEKDNQLKRLAALVGRKYDGSQTTVRESIVDEPVPLPHDPEIRFGFGPKRTDAIIVRRLEHGDGIQIHTSMGALQIKPQVSNQIEVELCKR